MSKLLEAHTRPFLPYLRRKDLVEICVNKPGEVFLETKNGTWERKVDKAITLNAVLGFASALATAKGQQFSSAVPLLSTNLPGFGYRVQIMGETITDSGCAVGIRVSQAARFPLSSYFPGGREVKNPRPVFQVSEDPIETLKRALKAKRNILVAGGTSSGKTTFLNSLIYEISNDTRLISVEDTKELVIDQPNTVRIIKSKTGTDVAGVSYRGIINSCVRLRPDSLLLGEFDDENTLPFLRLLNTGHGGSMGTIHANSASEAMDAIVLNAQLVAKGNPDKVEKYARKAFDLVVFCSKLEGRKFAVNVSEVDKL